MSVLVLTSCDQDPFGFNTRTIAGVYQLERAESNYFLIDQHHPDAVGGVVEGVVLSIGWDQHRILVERHSIFRGDPDGLMVIELANGKILGPLHREDVAADPQLQGIKLLPVAEAWQSLGVQVPASERKIGPVDGRIATLETTPQPSERTSPLATPGQWCGVIDNPDPLLSDAVTMASPSPDNTLGLAGMKLIHRIPNIDRRDIAFVRDEVICEQAARAYDIELSGTEHSSFIPVKVIRLRGVWVVEAARRRSILPWTVAFFDSDWRHLGMTYGGGQ